MKIIATNIAEPTTFLWQGKQVTSGIYKKPTKTPIYLQREQVSGDEVSDRRVHGGEFKACYLFSENQYPYWKNLYPNLDWSYGMLGENLTVQDLDEKALIIGDTYSVGNAEVQITIPREPCFKFAYKFGSDAVVQQFIDHGYSGSYVRVIKEGEVNTGDTLKRLSQTKDSISIFQLFHLLYADKKSKEHIQLMLASDHIPQRLKKRLQFFMR